MLTYADLIDHGTDFMGATTSPEDERRARGAVQAAYRELANCRKWSYFYQLGRIATIAPYSTGTVVFDFSGGAHERMLTLTTGTWPTWAALGVVVIDSIPYDVATRVSDSIITLTIASNPGADVASTTYTLYRDTYSLPCDFQSMGQIINHENSTPLTFVHAMDWLSPQQHYQGPSTPLRFCITSDPNYFGTMAVRLYPFPDAVYPLGFIYHRKPRDMKLAEYADGTASITNGSTTLTGTATLWKSSMVGAVVRFAAAGEDETPTGLGGANPYTVERMVTAFTSTTAMTLDADPATTLTDVKHSVSDPADVDEGAMANYLLRLIEHHIRLMKREKPTAEEMVSLNRHMILAFEADSRSFEPKGMYGSSVSVRLRDYPRAADVG